MFAVLTLLVALGAALILVPAWPLPPRRYFAVCAGLGLIGVSLVLSGTGT